jgi:N-acetylmuramoyl-L-alanine amidase
VVRHQIRRFGGLAVRLLAAALMVVASMGLAAAGAGRGVSAQEAGLTAVPGENATLVSDLVVAQAAEVIGQVAYVAAETLSYREGPGLDAAVIDLLPYGSTGVITDGPVAMDGYTWFEFDVVGYGDAPGWVAGEFLATDEGASSGNGFPIGSEVQVASDELNLRDEPGLSGATLATLPIGMTLTILDGPLAVDGFAWYLVQDQAQVGQGWVAGEFLVASPGPNAAFGIGETVVVNGDELNLRSEPSLNGSVVAQLPLGKEAVITGGPVEADGYSWYQITLTGTHPDGWVAGEHLTYP